MTQPYNRSVAGLSPAPATIRSPVTAKVTGLLPFCPDKGKQAISLRFSLRDKPSTFLNNRRTIHMNAHSSVLLAVVVVQFKAEKFEVENDSG